MKLTSDPLNLQIWQTESEMTDRVSGVESHNHRLVGVGRDV